LQCGHYGAQDIEFREGEIDEQAMLPRELFDSAADNLIQNAINKRKQQESFAIAVSFSCGDRAVLEVCDAGKAIASETARELLRGPVPSDSGLGIGLYQVARQAESLGFILALAHNADSRVSFVLSGKPSPAPEPPAA
jgi:sensor histidine kinase regulating citrate/malate metabolism